ncbi:carbonic anhydrase [Suillus decipiens]|nr:carbonic anhydrase [Suillus decipiens]
MSQLHLNAAKGLINANKQWAQRIIKANPNFFKDSDTYPPKPKVLWIGCSDSRVPASVVTASMPGDILTHTNIANQFHSFDDNANSVLSCAISEEVDHDYSSNGYTLSTVVLVGHSICEGVQDAIVNAAAAEPVDLNNPIKRWLNPLTELVRTLDLSGLDESQALDLVTEANINKQVENICNSEPIVTAWAAGKRVSVHGWLYDLATGRIRELVVRSLPGP